MINNTNIIIILRGISSQEISDHVEELFKFGLTDIEVPVNSPDWEGSIRTIANLFGSSVNIGVGTVTSEEIVKKAAIAGARYIVTPNLDKLVIETAHAHNLKTCIGVFSPSEIFSATNLGIDLLKIFPASALPINFPALIKGPFSKSIPFAAVGGIDLRNSEHFLEYYDVIGLGSSVYKPGQSPMKTRENATFLQPLLKKFSA